MCKFFINLSKFFKSLWLYIFAECPPEPKFWGFFIGPPQFFFSPYAHEFRYHWLPKDRNIFVNHSSSNVNTCNRPCHQSLRAEPERHLICGRVCEAGPLNERALSAKKRTPGGAYWESRVWHLVWFCKHCLPCKEFISRFKCFIKYTNIYELIFMY